MLGAPCTTAVGSHDRMLPNQRKAFIEFSENEKVVGAFRMEISQLEPIKEILWKAANELSAIHFACRCELAGGM
jgi:hypothetical protein